MIVDDLEADVVGLAAGAAGDKRPVRQVADRDPGEHGVVGLLHAIVEKVSAARRAILDIELRDGVAGIGIGEVREQGAQRRRHAGSHGLAVSRRCVGSMVGRRYRCHGAGGSQAMIVDDLEADVVGLAAGAAGDKRPVRQVADRDPGEHGVVGLLHAIVEKVSAARRANPGH